MKRNLLLTPGPTQIPPEICAVLGRPIIHHRTPQFQENLKEAIEGLKQVFQTKNDVYLLTCSGTGAMEASVCNLLSPGDKAITVEGGKFGERWSELCRSYGVEPHVIQVTWGTAVDPVHRSRKYSTRTRTSKRFLSRRVKHPQGSRPTLRRLPALSAIPTRCWSWTRSADLGSLICKWTTGALTWLFPPRIKVLCFHRGWRSFR